MIARRTFVLHASLFLLIAPSAAAQSAGTPSATTIPATVRAPYLQRGDEVEQRYETHRRRLEDFFRVLSARIEQDAPDLRQKLEPPAPVPFGYQILPNLLADPLPQSQRSRIVLSPFSWPRTDSIIAKGNDRLILLESKLDSTSRLKGDDRRHAYESLADEYRKLVDGQKFMENLIQYNRLWQSEIARLQNDYKKNNSLREAALGSQALLDSIARGDEQFANAARTRIEIFSRQIDSAIRKTPTPVFIRAEHQTDRSWIVTVPVYTDIADSAFITRAKDAIESGWHVHDGDDDFSVILDIRRIQPPQLYAGVAVPSNGEHIDVATHVKRFPQDGVVLTTGANSTYVLGQSIILGPHAIPRKTLVHEFGHMLGFKDGYFRSYYDLGENGFNVVEVILDPDEIVAAPEKGKATRQHFEQIFREKLP